MKPYCKSILSATAFFISVSQQFPTSNGFLLSGNPIVSVRISNTEFVITNDKFDTTTKGNLYRNSLELFAKNTYKKRGKVGGPRGGGRRGVRSQLDPNLIKKNDDDGDGREDEKKSAGKKNLRLAEPTYIRKHKISLNRPGENEAPLRLIAAEVIDKEWWENPENDNPFGAKLWPSSLGVAKFLVNLGTLKNHDILELGCGAGLISIAAAENGARVVASDISETVLNLTKLGWVETQKQRAGAESGDRKEEASSESKIGTLNTFNMDLSSKRPLPFSRSSDNKKIVVAAAMMYSSDLAKLLARRAYEGCTRGAWVIIGDDDTGEREGGRLAFLTEFALLEKANGKEFPSIWIKSIVKDESLKWNEKRVQILHLNKPSDITLDD